MSDLAKRIQPIYHWDLEIGAPGVSLTTSQFLAVSDPENRNILINKNGKKYVRIFMADEEFTHFAEATQILGPPQPQIFWGTRKTSKATYFIWDPTHPKSTPFEIKMQRDLKFAGDISKQVNTYLSAKNSVITSDLVQQRMLKVGYDGSSGSLKPERVAVGIAIGDFSFANSSRAVDSLHGPPRAELAERSLHGVLGSPLLHDSNNFHLPALVKMLVIYNYELGFQLEAHTQNLISLMDRSTHALERLDTRDTGDIMWDPIINLAFSHSPSSQHIPFGVVNEFFDATKPGLKEPGAFFVEFGLHAVLARVQREMYGALTAEFFDLYLNAIKELIGVEIHLDRKHQNLLNRLRAGAFLSLEDDPASFSRGVRTVPIKVEGDWAAAELMDEIYEAVIKALWKREQAAIKIDPALHSTLDSIFKNSTTARRNFPFFAFQERNLSNLKYAWVTNGFWALTSTGEPVAFVYGLSQTEQAQVSKTLSGVKPARTLPQQSANTESRPCSANLHFSN